MSPFNKFKSFLYSFSKEGKTTTKLQKEFLDVCFSNDIEDIVEYLKKGATFEFYGDPAYGLKEILELPNSERHLTRIFEAMGGITAQFLAYPVVKNQYHHIEGESIFQFALRNYRRDTISAFIDNAHNTEVLTILENQTLELQKNEPRAVLMINDLSLVLGLIQKKKTPFLEKDLLQEQILPLSPGETAPTKKSSFKI